MAAAGTDGRARHRSAACCLMLWLAVAAADQVALACQPTPSSRPRIARSLACGAVAVAMHAYKPGSSMGAGAASCCLSSLHRDRRSRWPAAMPVRSACHSVHRRGHVAGQHLVHLLAEPVHVIVTGSLYCGLVASPASWRPDRA